MNEKKLNCRNYNHGKMNPTISFCPNCGDRFQPRTSSRPTCDEKKHNADRKNRNSFCTDCGKSLK